MLTTTRKTSATSAYFAPIARDLEQVEEILARTLASPHPWIAELTDHLVHYRGKRLRPALLLLTAKACGRVTPAHATLGAVVEMIHTATLVHDDVLDHAQVRRHVSTVNAAWGNHTSILLGDLLFTHAFHLASTVDAEACRLIGEATNRVCAGEIHQGSESGNVDLTEADYFEIIEGKTAALTDCCCHIGAFYSGMETEVVEAMGRYGRALGMAFQIADDVLDLIGEERSTGKSLGTDVAQRKMTLPLIRLLANAEPHDAVRIRDILLGAGNHKVEALRPWFERTDAIRYAQSRAQEFALQARAELRALPASPCREILDRVLDQVIHRST